MSERPEVNIYLQPGPQTQAGECSADIMIFGGQAGGGKTRYLLTEPLRHIHNPNFGAVFFRRTIPDITSQGGAWDEAQAMYSDMNVNFREKPYDARFPSGSKIQFRQIQYDQDRFNWKSAQIPLILLDQLEEFSDTIFWYLFSRSRSMCGVRPYIRASANPKPDSFLVCEKEGDMSTWGRGLISWWIDKDGYPIPERSGIVRWFTRDPKGESLVWGDTPQEAADKAGVAHHLVKSITFIMSRLEDNQLLMEQDPGYEASMTILSFIERERLRKGNWKIRPAAGLIFNREWFKIVPAMPINFEHRIRAWDKAATPGSGDHSAGIRGLKFPVNYGDNLEIAPIEHYGIDDLVYGQWGSKQREEVMLQTAQTDGFETSIWLEREPASSGKDSAEASLDNLSGFDASEKLASGDKGVRAMPLSAKAEKGHIFVLQAPWTETFLENMHNFTGEKGGDDDIPDAAALCYNQLLLGPQLPWIR